ncbi:glucokinase [Sulfitobacter sabulilitoris]|uniref:Glucokinase n=1 Tax=Sulfitobacter sabulilitoris TaxID=2562655 RepID=A0A5S3PKI7_9RHOB|nr:glucokinase [Sulfitobacter sabulilitoris]TMM54060.1 glucokinase [Sulfitobacter sabulilitoris]
MTLVLADVGGTNLRFAVAEAGSIDPARTLRFENDAHAGFDAALAAYLAQAGVGKVSGFAIAVAGPVAGTRATLTNRDWTIDAQRLQRTYPGATVRLLNDLSALGYALDLLRPADVTPVWPGTRARPDDAQRLVVGVGTGFNLSPVLRMGGRSACLRVEYGLSSLPERAAAHLRAYLGDAAAAGFGKVEHAMSGPGLARMHALATGQKGLEGADIDRAAGAGDAAARRTLDVFATMLGDVIVDLRLQYMPLGGVYLAGSVARGLVHGVSRTRFCDQMQADPGVAPDLRHVPVSLITRDDAALLGCLNSALSAGR